MISIIINAYDVLKSQRHMTMACMGAIRSFTDPEYEIIVVDNCLTHRLRDDYGVLAPFLHIENEQNRNVYASYNQGARVAKGNYLIFMQNDVFVTERAINKLVEYLKEFDVAYPQQIELSREQVKEIYNTPDGSTTPKGWRDAGMLAITSQAFAKTGGWDERFHNMLGEKAYYFKIDEVGLNWTSNTNAIVVHIKAGNNLSKPEELYNQEMDHDDEIMKEFYD
jgi:glycosyltransferase involved in cell wall biosynthesis